MVDISFEMANILNTSQLGRLRVDRHLLLHVKTRGLLALCRDGFIPFMYHQERYGDHDEIVIVGYHRTFAAVKPGSLIPEYLAIFSEREGELVDITFKRATCQDGKGVDLNSVRTSTTPKRSRSSMSGTQKERT